MGREMVPREGTCTPKLCRSESGPSAIGLTTARELVHPAGLPPANSPFEAEDDNNFTTDAEMVGPTGTRTLTFSRLRDGTSLLKFSATRNRDTKAELNRRGQICEVLIDTGISRREKKTQAYRIGCPAIASTVRGLCEHPIPLGKWTGMWVARPLFRFGRPACVSQHLCPEKIGIPCGNRTSLCGFADRRLSCSANGMEIEVRAEAFASARFVTSWRP